MERVNLDNTGVGAAKASWVARQIDLRRVSERQLTRLDWSTGDVVDQDITDLATVLTAGDSCTHTMVLTELKLGNNADLKNGATLVHLIEQRPSLVTVDVAGTGLDQAVQDNVEAAARRNRLLPDIKRVANNDGTFKL